MQNPTYGIGVFDDPHPNINKCLAHVDSGLARILDEMKKVKPDSDMDNCLVEQLKEQLSGLKLELFDVSRSILALTEDTTVRTEEETRLSRDIFEVCLFIRRLLSMLPPVAPAEPTAVPTAPTVPTI